MTQGEICGEPRGETLGMIPEETLEGTQEILGMIPEVILEIKGKIQEETQEWIYDQTHSGEIFGETLGLTPERVRGLIPGETSV